MGKNGSVALWFIDLALHDGIVCQRGTGGRVAWVELGYSYIPNNNWGSTEDTEQGSVA